MSPDDPRHGTLAGYREHFKGEKTPTCGPCRQAMSAYTQQRRHAAGTATVPSRGYVRRVRALQALGWSMNALAERLDADVRTLAHSLDSGHVFRRTHDAMAALYEELCMTRPDDQFANRRRIIAERKGYVPPLAWDDIDLDDEPASPGRRWHFIDEIAVERAVAGDPPEHLTPAERRAVVRRLHARGCSDGEIAARSGMVTETAMRIRHELGLPAIEQGDGITTQFSARGALQRRKRAAA